MILLGLLGLEESQLGLDPGCELYSGMPSISSHSRTLPGILSWQMAKAQVARKASQVYSVPLLAPNSFGSRQPEQVTWFSSELAGKHGYPLGLLRGTVQKVGCNPDTWRGLKRTIIHFTTVGNNVNDSGDDDDDMSNIKAIFALKY